MQLTEEQSRRVEELLSQMTLEEKLGQMNLESVSLVGGFDVPFEELIEMMTDGRITKEQFNAMMANAEQDYHEDDIAAGRIGALMVSDPEKCNHLQKVAVEQSRLHIPLIFGLDVIHGFKTVYPIAIAEACSFDPDLFERTARMAAKESRTHGVCWHFAPMLDAARDARWGRVSEGPGEDPYMGSIFGASKIKGLQGDTSSPQNYIAACLKHYVAYGACESGRDYNTTSMSVSNLHNIYLPAFKAAVEAGAATIMASFNDLNGVPCTVNPYTLRKVLKEDWEFPGFVVSDANAIRECVIHGIASDNKDAGIQAANAGMDMDMGCNIYKDELPAAVQEGKVSMDVIDDAVRRVLSVKMWLGLFEHPYVPEEIMHSIDELPQEHVALAREAGQKSIVLLKNEDQILPLKKDARISLVGQLADMPDEVVGAWSLSWNTADCVTLKKAFESRGADMKYFACCGPETPLNEEEAEAACAYGDVIVALLGETVAMSGEASSRADITLPGDQSALIDRLAASGKPVILLLQNGRPLVIAKEIEKVTACVECWHLGVQMGNAIADVLFGDVNPEGRLSTTFPYATGQCPIYMSHPNTGRPGSRSKFTSRYLDAGFAPLFAFGEGLSYTTYEYSDLALTETPDAVEASVTVKNTGAVKGTETVQLYMQDVTGSLVRPVKELKGFAKVSLEAGEEKRVSVTLKKENMGFCNNEAVYVREDGLFRIYMGHSSKENLMQEIEMKF